MKKPYNIESSASITAEILNDNLELKTQQYQVHQKKPLKKKLNKLIKRHFFGAPGKWQFDSMNLENTRNE